MNERFIRTSGLIGDDGVSRLQGSSVAVFGIGGVGSYAAEALVRSGVGTIWLYDSDKVSKSNLNRQLIALDSTVGMLKTTAAAERLRDISPDTVIHECPVFITPETPLPFDSFDFIIDAIDNVTAKLYLIESAAARKIPIISVTGTGNRLDPTKLSVCDIYKTSGCPLARVLRYELRRRGIENLPVVWSSEKPSVPFDTGELRENGGMAPASIAMVPGTAGLIAASYAVSVLTNKR